MFKYFNKIILILALAVIFFIWPFSAGAREKEVNVYFFYGDGCPHCAAEEKFLSNLKVEMPNIKVHYFETWHNRENSERLQNIIKLTGAPIDGVPSTIVGERAISGFFNEQTTGQVILQAIEYYQAAGDPDVVGKIISGQDLMIENPENLGEPAAGGGQKDKIVGEGLKTISLPLFGEIKTKEASLAGLSVIIGFLDGFNPCAMWVLLFLISMLLGMTNKKRMWAIGLTFIIASGAVYFLFMAAWLNVFKFIDLIFWIRLVVGLVAIASGAYHLREFYKNKDGSCKVVDEEKRNKIFDKIKNIISEKNFALAMIGVIGLAAAVNMIELVCSAGLPAIYTSILAAADLASWQYYGYLLLYIFIFIIDDLAIFIIAMTTLQVVGITKKYVRAANLIGGIIILLIGILLIFKPELLLFG